MNCKNCGAEIREGDVFCGNCGMRVENEHPVHEEPVQEVHTEYQEQGTYYAPVQPEDPEPVYQPEVIGERPNTVRWIVLTAIEIFTCCQLTGIIGLIFAIMGHIAAEKEDYENAAKKIKIAKILFYIGVAIGVVVLAFFALVLGLGMAVGFTEELLYN
jgi:hypothetical protein